MTAVWNYICRATKWAIKPTWTAMLQWKVADRTWPTWQLGCILRMFGGARLATTTTQLTLDHQFLFMCTSILWSHRQMSGNFLLWEVNWAQKIPFFTYFGFCQLSFRYRNGQISGMASQILVKIEDFSILVVRKLISKFEKNWWSSCATFF